MPELQLSVVMMGATGAVGTEVVRSLVGTASLHKLTLLGRRPLEAVASEKINQHNIDIFDTSSYASLLLDHHIAICTLGVGQPSKTSREEFIRIDKDAVLDFATECKFAGVRHFELLCSVGANADSRSFFLRIKGELQDGLKELQFERLSIFQPSMILTETNRYGFSQALTLALWPSLGTVMIGPLRKYRGIPVDELGHAIANNAQQSGTGVEILQWDDIKTLGKP